MSVGEVIIDEGWDNDKPQSEPEKKTLLLMKEVRGRGSERIKIFGTFINE